MAMPGFLDSIRFALRFSLRSFTDHSVNALLAARKRAVERRLHDITPEDVLFAVAVLPRRCAATIVLGRLGLEFVHEAVALAALADFRPPGESYAPPRLAPETMRLLDRAQEQARGLGVNYVGTEHLVLGLLDGTGAAVEFLRERGISTDRFLAELEKLYVGPNESSSSDRPTG
jgi:ATP-dependent Clp protease ATP-binding subunit ClpC